MTNLQKSTIKTKLEAYVARYASQNKAASSLKEVSAATISHVLAGKWEQISDDMWRNLESQVAGKEWSAVETRPYKLFTQFLADAQAEASCYAIVASAGSGKSFTAAHYAQTHSNVYHLVCGDSWRPQAFLAELLRVMGHGSKANNNDNAAMLHAAVSALSKQNHPLLILDEADKLHDTALYFFITLYNRLEDNCGIVMCATPYFEKKITDGLRLSKRGYNEVFSRMGRRFINIGEATTADIKAICLANDITDEDIIAEVVNDSDNDLRRVKRKIHAIKIANR